MAHAPRAGSNIPAGRLLYLTLPSVGGGGGLLVLPTASSSTRGRAGGAMEEALPLLRLGDLSRGGGAS